MLIHAVGLEQYDKAAELLERGYFRDLEETANCLAVMAAPDQIDGLGKIQARKRLLTLLCQANAEV
jgi:hypothetical protein